MTIFWFRRDLRLDDNAGLYHALYNNSEVLPIFIFDKNILDLLEKDDARVSFIYQQLEKINEALSKINKSIAVFYGEPKEVFKQLIAKHTIKNVYTNHDYEPYARKRDLELNTFFLEHNITFFTSKDQVIFEKNDILKDNQQPYVVYTPYSNKWKSTLQNTPLPYYDSVSLLNNICRHYYPFLKLEDIGFKTSNIKVPSYNIDYNLIDKYQTTRDYPAIEGTSKLGIYLRFGTLSIRQLVQIAQQHDNKTFLNELIWREFFMQILWHFPHTVSKSFKPQYDAIPWENNEALFKKWREGNTGYPFVDAGMRELNATGIMHNRVRMIVASFLCKHLLIDWRWGESYFANKLLDYEQASNVGNWQWAAGSGVDAAPYFRIFNPEEQIKKFDKELRYIKKWIPEYGTSAYPKPIVEHKTARERCLATYKKALG